MWNTILIQPITNLLIAFYHLFFSNLGLAILGMTVFIRLLLFPLTLPALKMAEKQKKLQPKLDKLKEKYKDDKEKLAREQMKLMKEAGVNPALGCLPQIVQLIILIALYQVFIKVLAANGQNIGTLNSLLYLDFLKLPSGAEIGTKFLYLDLSEPDPYYILPILAGLSQWGMTRIGKPRKAVEKKGVEKEKKDDIMGDMQSQMGILFPIMTVFIGLKLQSGLVLYWLASVLTSMVQQWWVTKNLKAQSARGGSNVKTG